MPLQAFKLLAAIIERNTAFVTIMKKLKLIEIMIDYFKVGNEKFNSYLVKIIAGVIESKDLTMKELVEGKGPG